MIKINFSTFIKNIMKIIYFKKDKYRRISCSISEGLDGIYTALLLCLIAIEVSMELFLLNIMHNLKLQYNRIKLLELFFIQARIKLWMHNGISSGIQNYSRRGRYCMLIYICKKINSTYVLHGHHILDNIENFFYKRGIIYCNKIINKIIMICPNLLTKKSNILKFNIKKNNLWVEDYYNYHVEFNRIKARKIVQLISFL